jgi:hypothetical protein
MFRTRHKFLMIFDDNYRNRHEFVQQVIRGFDLSYKELLLRLIIINWYATLNAYILTSNKLVFPAFLIFHPLACYAVYLLLRSNLTRDALRVYKKHHEH